MSTFTCTRPSTTGDQKAPILRMCARRSSRSWIPFVVMRVSACIARVGRTAAKVRDMARRRPAGRPPLSRNSTCGPPLAALEPGRCRCGPRRGLRAEGVHGVGVQPTSIADRHKRCNTLAQSSVDSLIRYGWALVPRRINLAKRTLRFTLPGSAHRGQTLASALRLSELAQCVELVDIA